MIVKNIYYLNYINLQLNDLLKKQRQSIYSKIPLLHYRFPTLCEALGLEGLCVIVTVKVTVVAFRFEDSHGTYSQQLSPKGAQW